MFKKSKTAKPLKRRLIERSIMAFGAIFVSFTAAPQLLIFPYEATVGQTIVYSETPIPAEIHKVFAVSDALLKQSAIYSDENGKRIFLTDGGWRWRLLALRSSGAFAFTRAVTGNIVVNKSSVRENWVRGKVDVVRKQTLSGIIAHERAHNLISAKFGLRSIWFPTWKIEGYADYIAQESSLTAADVNQYRARGVEHPAIVYFEGRKKVTAILNRNGGSVDQLFSPK